MLQLSGLAGLAGLGRLDVVVADCDADDDGSCGGGGGGGPACLLHSELCCPTDSLDGDTGVVIEIIQDEELLKDLAIAASLPPTTTAGHHNNENFKSGCCWGVSPAGGTTSSSLVAEPKPPAVVVPTRKRDRSSVMSGTRSWSSSLDMGSVPTRRRSPNNRRRGPRRSIKRRLERACGRCGSRETPHWRAGPDGPGTLCNACGMRYTRQQCKLPLLLSEYRRPPSASQSRKKAPACVV